MNKELYALRSQIGKFYDETLKSLESSPAPLPMKDHGGEFNLPFREFFRLGVGSHIKLSDGTHFFKVSLPKDTWVNGLGFRLSNFEVVCLIIDSYLASCNPAFLINLEVTHDER
jgi:hypothetical protein|nr:MAG TPA: hypothetical protein [Caudoviricetes sp.]